MKEETEVRSKNILLNYRNRNKSFVLDFLVMYLNDVTY